MRSFEADFAVPAGYLNTPSIGIPPAHVADVVEEAVSRWRRGGDSPPVFDESVAVAREAFGRLVGVPGDTVAIGASVSQLIGNVAMGTPDGTRVLAAAGEFTSVTFPFAGHAHRGVTVTEVPLDDLPAHVDGYDVVAVSVVQSADGSAVDIEALREAAAASGARVLLDATQAAGWQPLRLAWADWVVGAGYKWLLSPRGAAWLAVRPDALERTLPAGANWYGGDDPWSTVYGLPLRLAGGARGLDLSPVWFAQAGAAAALPYLASLDLAAVRAHCVDLAGKVLAGLGLPPRDSAIVALEGDDAVFERLRASGVIAGRRAGKIRLGFHLYNSPADVELVLDAFE
ncbi:MAG: aminotransferase class [Amycolatopsis sp.]|uniref:aminotransferase class V-fold PLP-dependent enzyme n=1 Tax=Amycolatopsis sp. TaxID=37632 RepID=UPI00263419FB|nr:aminotransferase class V-fold PLP-dependent enzyme [Amycolatopsis sp.]MCU1682530.1 aminotransferase class [Amycolatopsis sp.]